MNQQLRRPEIALLAGLLSEQRRREAKKLQQTRGHRDAAGVWRGGLLEFVRYFWQVLEPGTKFVDGWALEAICEHLEAVTFGEVTKLLINVPPGFMKSLLTDVFWPAWEWGPMDMPHLRYVTFSYSSSLTERDNGKFKDLITSVEFQAMYGEAVQPRKTGEKKVSNWKHGWKLASSVGGVGTGERGDRAIIDDPHNVKESESKPVRQETIRWFRESLSSRLNDMENGAKVVIMQRVNEEDVAGTIIGEMDGWCHLLIPMEYVWSADENGEPFATDIGWTDPRWQPNMKDCEGELAWHARFPERIIAGMKKDIGPFGWACNPYEAPVLMADLSMRPIGTVAVGDKIVGFKIGDDARRARYQEATVLDIHKSLQQCVRIALDSGRVIRCTANHKWWTGRNDAGHPPYAPARKGGALRRACPPSIDLPSGTEAIRAAGWVAGFFDGEGSVSVNRKRDRDEFSTPLITFTQGAGRNLPICERLEASLRLLGFDFGVRHRERRQGLEPMRSYWLKAAPADGSVRKGGEAKRLSRISLYQRFLHAIQPTKWRDRIVDGAVNGRVFTTHEKVISIEPDVTEEVYGLTTTTGNYVVWGLASSNSQYQQTPETRGGAIFEREWWQPWEPADGKFPVFSYIVASCDSAFGEKENADPSACVVLGLFENEHGFNRVMVIEAWRRNLKFSGPVVMPLPGEKKVPFEQRQRKSWGLVEWLADTCLRRKADRLLIENKASGISASQALANSHPHAGWAVQLVEPKGDKWARAQSVQPTFSQEMVFIPWPLRQWGADLVDEMAIFPKGKYDDMTDAMTQGIKHMRDLGLLRNDSEVRHELVEAAKPKGRPKKLYPGTAGRAA